MSKTTHIGFTTAIHIAAPPEAVWDVLLDPNAHWARAFGEGTVVETDWREGSPIVWCDNEGNIGASGAVEVNTAGKHLLLRYHDKAERHPVGPLGRYTEGFTLTDHAGATGLRLDIGAIPEVDDETHQQMWERALQFIQRAAEARP